MRRKFTFQTLEPRLLLSADLAPVEGVLEVVGTNETDFAFITALQERLVVELNGESFEFALEDVKEIKVDLLGGDDALVTSLQDVPRALKLAAAMGSGDDSVSHELGHALLQGFSPIEASFDMGEGNNDFAAHFVNTFGAVDVAASGVFENAENFVLSGNLVIAQDPDASGLLGSVSGGDGRDAVTIDMSQLALSGTAGAPLIQFDLDTGAGDDLVKVALPVASRGGEDPEPIDPAERRAPVSVRYDSRAGADAFELVGGDAAERYGIHAFDDPDRGRSFEFSASDIATGNPLAEVATLTVTHVGVHTGAGDDALQGRVVLDADWNVELGDGDDIADIETLIGDVFADARYRVDAGEGDNETTLRFGDGEHGARPPSGETNVRVEYRSGSGDDRASFDWLVHLDRELLVDVDASTGAGDDFVTASWKQQQEFRTGKVVLWDHNFETGSGDDVVELHVAPGEGIDALGAQVQVASVVDEFGRIKVKFPFDASTSGEADVNGAERLRLETGSGDDRVTVDDVTGALRALRLDVFTGAGDDEYQYVPVGRFAQYLEESLGQGLQWAVFDGGEGDDRFTLATSDRAERIEIEGVEVGDVPDPLVRVTDLATALGTLQASVLATESIRVDSAGGDDVVDVALSGDHAALDLTVDTGSGDDTLTVQTSDVRLGAQSRVQWLYDLGAGDDDVTHIRANWEIDEGAAYDWTVELGEGDDTFQAAIDGQTIGDAAQVGYGFFGGAGDDRFEIELKNLAIAGGAAFRSQVDAGDGDDLVLHEATHIVQQGGSPADEHKPAEFLIATGAGGDTVDSFFDVFFDIDVEIDAGAGDDILQTDVFGGVTPDDTKPAEFRPAEFRILGGSGDDTVRYRYFAITDRTPVTASSLGLFIDLGSGNDRAEIDIDTTNVAAGIVPCMNIGVDAGPGSDQVSIDARGAFEEFDLSVDLGTAATGNDVPIETLSLNFEKIDLENDDTAACWIRAAQLAGAGGMSLALSAGGAPTALALDVQGSEGDDLVEAQILGFADVSVNVDTHGGNDSIWMDLGFPPSADGTSNTLLVAEVRGGAGDDLLEVSASGASSGMDLVLDAGDGNDTVMFNPREYTLSKSAHWNTRIDTGDGDDALTVRTSNVHLGAQSRVEWLYDLGAGDDDVTHIRANWEIDEGALYNWDVELGAGDDTFQAAIDGQAIGDGAHVGYGFLGGAGDDRFEIELKNLAIAGSAVFRSQIAAGDGDDTVNYGGTNPQFFDIFVELDVDLGEGDDRAALLLPAVQAAREAAHKVHVDGGAGEDALSVDTGDAAVAAGFKNVDGLDSETEVVEYELKVDALAAQAPVARLGMSGMEAVTLETGAGDDRIQVDVSSPSAPAPALDVRTGAGDDTVLASWNFEKAWPAKWSGPSMKASTAAGNDRVAIDVDTTGVAAGVQPCVLIAVDGGLGGDQVGVDARGVLGEFDLKVDLGADATADTVPTESFSLNFSKIEIDYSSQSKHSYRADGSDGAKAIYEVGLRSDGELVQATYKAETVGGLVSDQVDIQIGGGRTQSVGSNLSVAAGNRGGADAGEGMPGLNDIRVIFDGLDNASMESAVSFKGGAAHDVLHVDLAAGDAPVRAGFSEVSGLGSEVSPVDYRAGAKIGGEVSLQVDMAGVDAFELIAGDGDDEIDIDLVYPTAPVPSLAFETRGGDDTIRGSFLGIAGALQLALDTGDGDDVVDLDYTEAATLVTGAGMGGGPHVKSFSGASAAEVDSFFAYDPQFTGGVRVAVGDVNGDGVADIITGAGPGGGPHVKVFDGRSGAELRSFSAYAPSFTGGVNVASGDVNNDGFADIITGAGAGGGPHVRVFSGATGEALKSFFAYAPTFTGGVNVASGDVNNDGFDDIITGAGAGGGPHVRVFDGVSGAELRSFFAYDPSFTGGVYVAAGDVNGDGHADVVTGAGASGGPHVRVFSGATGAELRSFFAYTPSFTGGVRVAAGDLNGDGLADIVTGPGPGAGPHVKVFDGRTGAEVRGFFAYDPSLTGGVYVAAGDIDGGATFDLALDTGAGDDAVRLRLDTGASRSDAIAADLGTGADRFELKWQGALQEPSVEVQVLLEVALGGPDTALPELGDEVLVSFEHGDMHRPIVLGTLWNSQDASPEDAKSLEMTLTGRDETLGLQSALTGGSGRDEVTLSYAGTLRTAAAGQIDALVDLGDGDDAARLDFSGLMTVGPQTLAPISVDLRGGTGRDTLSITGTEGNDRFALAPHAVLLEGAANATFAGFDLVQVQALGGNDQVRMTGFAPRIDWLIDGGEGRDRFAAPFDFAPFVVNFEKVQVKKIR